MTRQKLNVPAFVADYLKNFNPRVAILVAGYEGIDPDTAGMQLLQEPGIQNEIMRVIESRAKALDAGNPDVLKKLWLVASADVTELVQVSQGCCRHCWGRDHRYQRTPEEYRKHLESGGAEEGGGAYYRKKAPNPACPECCGDGETFTRYTPTDQLTPSARALCAGYVQTRQGLKLKVHDQVKAMEILVRHQKHLGHLPAPRPEAAVPAEPKPDPYEKIRQAQSLGQLIAELMMRGEEREAQKLINAIPRTPVDEKTYRMPCLREPDNAERHVVVIPPLSPPVAVAPAPAGIQASAARALVPPPPEGGGEGEGCAPPARAVASDVIPTKAGIQVRAAHAVASTPLPSRGERAGGERGAPQAPAFDLTPANDASRDAVHAQVCAELQPASPVETKT